MDTQGSPSSPHADWYQDPSGRHEYRFWDGTSWSDNVADAGTQSVDPLEAQVTDAAEAPVEPAASGPETPAAAPKTSSGGVMKAVIIGVAAVLAIVLISAGYSMAHASSVAKDAAAASIASAKKAVVAADLATEPGSIEVAQNQKSKAQLAAANKLFGQGWFLSAGPYRDAKTKAVAAQAYAESITNRVAAMHKEAAAQSDPSLAMADYFQIAKQFPRTKQGQDAIGNAAQIVLNQVGQSDFDALASIKEFCATCPGDIPTDVTDAAATHIASYASAAIGGQRAVVSNNRSWVKKLKGKGANFTVEATLGSDTADLSTIIAMLPTVQATRYRTALVLLRDSSKLGERAGRIASSPVRRSGSNRYFSMGQVNQIDSISKQMAAKLTRASQLLNGL